MVQGKRFFGHRAAFFFDVKRYEYGMEKKYKMAYNKRMPEKDVPNEIRIIKTDKRFRNLIIWLYGVIFVGGAFFAVFALPSLLYNINHLHLQTSISVSETVFITFILCFIFPAFKLIRIGRKIKLHAQFPFPGMKVIRDTPVITGKKAIAKANMLIYFGAFAVIISILGSLHLHFAFQKIAHSELIRQLPLF
jgi:hypothetical protein